MNLRKNCLMALMTLAIVLSLFGCGAEDQTNSNAERRATVKAELEKRQKQKDEECRLIKETISSLITSEPNDMTGFNCGTYKSDCDMKVPVMLRLNTLGKSELLKKVATIGADCQKEYDFALDQGYSIWREHYDLLKLAVEKAFEDGQESGSERCNDGP